MNSNQEKILISLRAGNINEMFINSKFQEHITVQKLGYLFLPTGNIIANDPLCLFEFEPFEKCVPPGKYPVVLYIHHIDDDCRVAFAEIRFSENTPVSYELALTKQQNNQRLIDDKYFGYGVDSGTGCFMDKEACNALEELVKDIDDGMLPELNDMLNKSYVYTYSTANFTLPNSNNNFVVFSSGYGDGCYPSFWSYDEKGDLCSLITDFMTIDDEEQNKTQAKIKPVKKSFFDNIKNMFRRTK